MGLLIMAVVCTSIYFFASPGSREIPDPPTKAESERRFAQEKLVMRYLVRSKYSADIETLSEHDFRGRHPHESQATFGGIDEDSFGCPTPRTWGSGSSTHAFAEMCQITTGRVEKVGPFSTRGASSAAMISA